MTRVTRRKRAHFLLLEGALRVVFIGRISGHLSHSQPGAAKEVSATTGRAGALPARLAALPVNGAFVKGGGEDT